MKTLVIVPYYKRLGGVEMVMERYYENTSRDIYLLELYKFKLLHYCKKQKSFRNTKLKYLFKLRYSAILSFYWQFGLISPFLSPIHKKLYFFVNSTIGYTWLKKVGFNLNLKFANSIICDGAESLDLISNSYPKMLSKTYRFNFSPDIERLKKVYSTHQSKKQKYVFVSRWSCEKGVYNISELDSSVLKNLLIITDNAEEARNVYPNLNIIDGQNYDEVLSHIANSYYLISLSPKEGASLVMKEAILLNTIPLMLSENHTSNKIMNSLNSQRLSSIEKLNVFCESAVFSSKKNKEVLKLFKDELLLENDFVKNFDDLC